MEPRMRSEMASVVRNCSLPAPSAYNSWPRPLIRMICRSYLAHDTTIFGGTLPAAFQWKMEIEPADFEEALKRGGADSVRSVYNRMAFHPPLWAFVDLIYQAYTLPGHFDAFDFSVESPGHKLALINFLNSSGRFCRDTPLGQSMHQGNRSLLSRLLNPNHTCWREMVRGAPGLHICVEKGAGYHDNSIHIDPHQVVLMKNLDGTCIYDPIATAQHFWDIRHTAPFIGSRLP